eukprot:755671-Hanusia_phi.AAC.3
MLLANFRIILGLAKTKAPSLLGKRPVPSRVPGTGGVEENGQSKMGCISMEGSHEGLRSPCCGGGVVVWVRGRLMILREGDDGVGLKENTSLISGVGVGSSILFCLGGGCAEKIGVGWGV